MKLEPGEILYKKLLVRNRIANFFIREVNKLYRNRNKETTDFFFKKILVCNNAHLGDVILSTSVLSLLEKNFPEAKINFLCGSWSNEIVKNHPIIHKVHFYDHWKLNRSSKNLIQKIYTHYKTYKIALKEIKEEKYDLAIDLYFYYPNSIYLLWKSKIPVRIGYASGGFSNLLTRGIEWSYKKQSVVWYYLDLIRLVTSVTQEDYKSAKPNFPSFPESAIKNVHHIISSSNITKYLVVHVGTGLLVKEWPKENWKELVVQLIKNDFYLVFTGYGAKEQMLIDWLIDGHHNCLNLCNKLSLIESSYLIKNAVALICVDSVAGHIASSFDTSCIVIGNGINDSMLWKPISKNSEYLVEELKCMPCYTGCQGMECVRNIKVHRVLESIEKIN